MANPQKENGFTAFANELFEAMIQYPFQVSEMKVFMKVARDTYGWSRKKAQISYQEIAEASGLSRKQAYRACQQLLAKRVFFVQKTPDGRANILGINKNYEEWVGVGLTPEGMDMGGDTKPLNKGRRRAVDNSEAMDMGGDITMDMPGDSFGRAMDMGGDTAMDMGGDITRAFSVATCIDNPAVQTMDMGGDTNKQERKELKETEKKGARLVQNLSFRTPEAFAQLIAGWEHFIPARDPRGLVYRLVNHGFDRDQCWAAIVQSRSRPNPAGYLVKLLTDSAFPIAESAFDLARLERGRLGE